ncbi:MAG: Uma2 family endonuclease [Myxococcaceae bacterium]
MNERVELIDGHVVRLEPHSVRHANAIESAAEAFCGCLRVARVRVQLPMVIGDERLIPDIAVVDRKLPKTEHPSTAHLVVEVADSSVRYDRIVKAPLYAAAGVTEYWLIDTAREQVEVFSALRNRGYGKHAKVSKGALPVPGFPSVTIALKTLFP